MRRITLGGTDLTSSVLGMGCASLGSRYGAGSGLRALEAAFARGITWFDVAPAYGAGEAEAILARFLRGRREQVAICTKVGLAAPTQGFARRMLLPLARPVVARLKGARGTVRQSGMTSNLKLPLTAALIEESIARSLARLGTDRVEVYALHDPTPEEIAQDEVLRALERVIARGQARFVAVAGERPAALAAAATGRFPIVQTADDPLADPLDQVRAAAVAPLGTISHSVLGAGGTRARLAARLEASPDRLATAHAAGFAGPPGDAAARLLLARALAANGGGPVLASMFGRGNLAMNAEVAALSPAACETARALVRATLD